MLPNDCDSDCVVEWICNDERNICNFIEAAT